MGRITQWYGVWASDQNHPSLAVLHRSSFPSLGASAVPSGAMFGLITGSGFYDIADLEERSTNEVDTPFGRATVTCGSWRGRPIAFLPRHGADHSVPPAGINYRANVWALKTVGVTSVFATAVSGGIDRRMPPGTLVIISDFLDFTNGRADTFFDGTAQLDETAQPDGATGFDSSQHHTDMTTPYDPALRSALLASAEDESIPVIDGGVYCTTNGPRFETPAEIEMMRILGGQLVGMTGYPEVALAREAGLRYASVGVIANAAAGMGDKELTADDIFSIVTDVAEPLQRLIDGAITHAGAST